jgi:hypothetical protein
MRVAGVRIGDRIEELPAEILGRLVEVREHLGDRRRSREGAEEAVLVDAIVGEQRREAGAVVRLDRRREPREHVRKICHGPLLLWTG